MEINGIANCKHHTKMLCSANATESETIKSMKFHVKNEFKN